MLARVYHKKKKRPLLLTEAGEGGGVEYQQQQGGMPRPTMQHQHQQHQYPYGGGDAGGYAVHSPPLPPPRQSSRSHSSRISRAFGGGGGHDERRGGQDKERKKSAGGLVKKVFGGGKKNHGGGDAGNYGNYGPPAYGPAGGQGGTGGVMYSDDDECEFDDDGGEYDEEDEEPQVMRPRRRFVRSGLTTYEQIISKNSMGRRFSRRSYMQPSITSVPSPCKVDGKDFPGAASPVKGVVTVDKENSPLAGNADPASAENSSGRGMSSLSSALQDVINSRPTALRSVVDPSAAPPRVQRAFVVEQTPDGNYFVASKRVPSGPTRQTMDDSFIGMNRQLHDQYGVGAVVGPPHAQQYGQPNSGNLGRRSEMDFMYRQKWGTTSALSAASGSSGSTPGSVTTSAASLLSMSKAGVRRRLSGAEGAQFVPLGGDSISTAPTAMASAAPRLRRSSSASKIAEVALSNQMGTMYVDETRGRSRSRSTDGLMLPVMPLRKDSAAILLQRGSFEDVDALPMTMDDLTERKPSIDKGPMTMDEFMFDKPAPPPPPPMLQRKGSNGKSGRSKRGSIPDKDDEDEEDNVMNRSFRNLKDVDALKRSRSLEEEEKVVTTTEETETEEEYPDYAEERATDDLGSSYEDESAVRTSNITDFLGGFKSRNSMNRNSLAGRNSLGRNSVGKNDFVSRAARSLRNSRKVALETAKVSSELSRKLREARARVPHDLRGDPPAPGKKRSGFRGRDGKRVRFDMTRYVREFEVIEPDVSDDEVQRWAQRDSEQDDEDEDDEDEHSTDDDSAEFGVPVPGAVLAAAMTDANAYYSNPGLNYTYPSRFSVGRQSAQEARPSVGRASIQEDKRVSVVSRRSNANQFEVFM